MSWSLSNGFPRGHALSRRLLRPTCRRGRSPFRGTLLCVLVLVAAIGCESERDVATKVLRQQQADATEAAAVDHLSEAVRYVGQLAELDRAEAARQVMFHLNRWAQGAQPSDWQRPALLTTWPPIAGEMESVSGIDQTSFTDQDMNHLELSYLSSRVARWGVAGERIDAVNAEWIEQQRDGMSADQWRELDRACRLFDWAVRNIRLEPLVVVPEGEQTPPMPAGLQFLGPGYRQTTLQTLWRGSGDAWARSRVFLELCRQTGLDACMLGLGQGSGLWVAAVRVGDQLYLFEPTLGLPVPGPGQQGVATLADARSDASVLRRLRVPGWFDYPVTSDDVKSCVALIDASPEMLSRRMRSLESGLTGDNRMRLTLDADALADRLAAIEGVERAVLWPMSLMARQYDEALQRLRRDNPMLDRYYTLTFGILTGESPVGLARWKHLTGNFSGSDEEEGARQIYMNARMPDAEIEALPYDVALQTREGVRRLPTDTPEQFAFRIQTVQQLLRHAKASATYWLALLQMDDGRFETAAGWFERRVLGAGEDGSWHDAARYNLARCDEHLQEYDEAIELYKTQGTPQEQGNRIRARLLQRMVGASNDDTSDVDAAEENGGNDAISAAE